MERNKERKRKSANGNPFSREPQRCRARVEIPFAGCLMRQSRGVIKCQTNAERESRSERLPHGTVGTPLNAGTMLAQAITLYKHGSLRLPPEERRASHFRN